MREKFLVPEDLWRVIVEGDVDPDEAVDVVETRRRFEELRARPRRRRARPGPDGPVDERLRWLLRGPHRDPDLD